MNRARKAVFFLIMTLLASGVIFILARTDIMEYIGILSTGSGEVRWDSVGYGASDTAMAAGWKSDGQLQLQPFTVEGKAGARWDVTLPEEYRMGKIAAVWPIRQDLMILGLYSFTADELAVFRLKNEAEPELLLREDCEGVASAQRMQNVRLSGFYQEKDKVYFGVMRPDALRGYSCETESGGITALGSREQKEASFYSAMESKEPEDGIIYSALVMPDGTWLLTGKNDQFHYLDIMGSYWVGNDKEFGAAKALTRGSDGWYYMNAETMAVHFVDPNYGPKPAIYNIGAVVGEYSLTSCALMPDGYALLVLDCNILLLAGPEGFEQFHGILEPTVLGIAGWLAMYLLIALAIAAILTYLLCIGRRGYTSMVVYQGSILVVLALLSSIVIRELVLVPLLGEVELKSNGEIIGSVVQAVLEERGETNEALALKICREMEYENDGYRNVRVCAAVKKEDAWVLYSGERAVSAPWFSAALANRVIETGTDETIQNGDVVLYCETRGDGVLMVYAENAASTVKITTEANITTAIIVAPIALAGILIFWVLGRRMRRLTRQMELVSDGQATGQNRLVMLTGDEFESMASAVNSLADWLEQTKRSRQELEQAYRRFVPEKVLSLLGKSSILEVNKDTFSVRRMTVMRVGYEFPRQVYTDIKNSRLLFDSINQVVERTASIATQKGGTIFNFSSSSYDVMMELDSAQAVSTAVAIQQQALSFNETRAAEGLPQVDLSIAIDVGDVILGLVGDTVRMEPAGISACFSVVQELFAQSRRLEAKILCTEMIVADAREYGNRYVGKCTVGSSQVRVYEIYEGDPYSLRRAKAGTAQDFSRAVLGLYSGDTAGAKKEFLRLAHNVPEDGSARYYLYLADAMERNPRLECSLDAFIDERERQ